MTPIGRGDGADRAARELLDPQYAHEALLDRLYRYFNQFLGDLMDGVAGGGTAGGIIAAVIIVLILVAVATLVGWQLRKTGRRNAMTAGALFGARATTAAEHRQRAEQLADEGHWSEAVQERLRAIARDLEERALVDGMPGRTADELAAEAGAALPGFAAELTAAARSFDDVTYGGVAGTRDAYETMTALDERLRLARPAPMGGPA
ncbi:membrane protein [Nonomuraea glycinis]|uniref:Membrane protein n=1 Tax=Nonomuraea glycinis TaxID=2047744 RepID=A0A918A4U0_9ACTN|nr:membrane protein [Nonomuraea glycinis]